MRPRKKVIGIGGNIRSFLQAFNAKEMDSKNFSKKVKELSGMTTQEKISRFQFSPDRADVIDNAMSIFQFIVTHLEAKTITATKWGVSDSIGVKLFHEIYSNKINIL
jgi:exopolyphosphatase/guanosine-5'-triphosphate,3'-diphosphate pyrophosphatase